MAGNRGWYAQGLRRSGETGVEFREGLSLMMFFRVIHLPLQEATEWLYLDRNRPRDTTGITGIPGNCLTDTGAFGGKVGKGRRGGCGSER